MDEQTKLELEAATFRRLIQHFQDRTDVQNIDVMNLAGFCRNCLSKWYVAEAKEKGLEMEMDDVREMVYGMPYGEWKEKYQKEAPKEKLDKFADSYEKTHGEAHK